MLYLIGFASEDQMKAFEAEWGEQTKEELSI